MYIVWLSVIVIISTLEYEVKRKRPNKTKYEISMLYAVLPACVLIFICQMLGNSDLNTAMLTKNHNRKSKFEVNVGQHLILSE